MPEDLAGPYVVANTMITEYFENRKQVWKFNHHQKTIMILVIWWKGVELFLF